MIRFPPGKTEPPIDPPENMVEQRRIEAAEDAASELNDVLDRGGFLEELTVASVDFADGIDSGEFVAEYNGIRVGLVRGTGHWRTNLHTLAEKIAHQFKVAEELEVRRLLKNRDKDSQRNGGAANGAGGTPH